MSETRPVPGWPAEWRPSGEQPMTCPYGHDLAPGHLLIGWQPCLCRPAAESHGGHRTYKCRDCEGAGRTTTCYIPECLDDPGAPLRRPPEPVG